MKQKVNDYKVRLNCSENWDSVFAMATYLEVSHHLGDVRGEKNEHRLVRKAAVTLSPSQDRSRSSLWPGWCSTGH